MFTNIDADQEQGGGSLGSHSPKSVQLGDKYLTNQSFDNESFGSSDDPYGAIDSKIKAMSIKNKMSRNHEEDLIETLGSQPNFKNVNKK